MSRSLARIRNLVSEIEEIHRNGQQGRRAAPEVRLAVAPEPQVETQTQVPVSEVPSDTTSPLVNLDDYRKEGQIFMRLKGSVALSLQMEDSGETIQVKQLGDMLEIRFEDGKAFHLPLKAVA
jgi:hypothetical protein